MNIGSTLYSQLLAQLPWTTFDRIVERYGGDHKVRTLSCREHFRVMAFAQLTYRESLRDIETCLGAQPEKLYRMGLSSPVKRSTLADANELRDWRMYADFAQVLIAQARRLYGSEPGVLDVKETVYALDSTTIDLCLASFPWAVFRRAKAAVKLHTLMDLRGSIPSFIHVSDGKMHDVNALDLLIPEAGSFYVMDRAYLSFERLCALHLAGAFFVTRAKSNTDMRRLYSAPSDREAGIMCDQTVVFQGVRTGKDYPHKLRRIKLKDLVDGHHLVFLTNNFKLPAATIAELYRNRWKVELFFKWIKQHLRIKKFYGLSENAVKCQIWIAVSVYLLVAIVRKRLAIEASLHSILQICSVMPFEKMPIQQAFQKDRSAAEPANLPNQLILFDF
jgi:hypothetical protein